ncbi:hypothetical protein Sfulv_00280 [Streptomyces fulvorobeus]|uniref:Secreted protein n=1 Tax=Streptomyces fulvorobeus TaxID=284028 RepID=A0A7J0BZP5_9ACTN|nr:hypothetical protein Sfulv_00280 [Streptomyces fulvorobeus]
MQWCPQGPKCVVSFVFAPALAWARVTAVPRVSAQSGCRRFAVRWEEPWGALPWTVITGHGWRMEEVGVVPDSVTERCRSAGEAGARSCGGGWAAPRMDSGGHR